ncbi:PAS domain S-box protein [Roseomonas harenae]|uniref:PAS domain S-box protein n=1 Tax=Muricoccus harenae TaxID=2692566 RepID=UPI001331A832|nr:PAS domain S-box protein [Roseomonas harenae]
MGLRVEHHDMEARWSRGPVSDGLGFLHGAGQAGELIERLGAQNCPLGGPGGWSATLCCALGIALPSRAQIVLFWGEEYVALYNDALAATIGEKHPRAMGRPARETWPELWEVLGPMLSKVRRTGETVHAKDHRFVTERHGFLEEVYFDISYSAVHEHGEVAGVMSIVAETTGRELADRRLRTLRALGQRLVAERSVDAACVAALRTMAVENPLDLPWGSILMRGEAGLATVATHGASPGPEVPAEVLEAVLREATPQKVPGALILPLMAGGAAVGIFVAGLSPHLPLAGEYASYLGMMAGQLSLAIGRLRREENERRSAAALRESEARFRNMADHAPVMVWMTDADGSSIFLSQRWYSYTGQTPETGLGFGWLDAVHPEDRDMANAVFLQAMRDEAAFEIEYRLRATDGTYAWMIDAAAPRRDGDGRFAGFVGSVFDISDRRRAEEARDLLARELSHRIKNIFMVAGGLASLAARGDAAAEAFSAQLQARLNALSLAHDLAKPVGRPQEETGRSGTVHQLLRSILAPYAGRGGANFTLDGVDRPLGYAAASTLALVLHEQATNAVKYGALSCADGWLEIDTRVEDGKFRLDWRETGGPQVPGPPSRQGFGTVLAARCLAGQIHGRMTHDWRPEGLVMQLELPEELLAR